MGKSQKTKTRINPYKLFVGVFIPNWLLSRPELGLGPKVLYGVLSLHAGKKGYCWPGQETLAMEICVTTRQIRRYLDELTRENLIEVDQMGLTKSNQYFFLDHDWMSGLEWTYMSGQDRTNMSGPNIEKINRKEKKEKEPRSFPVSPTAGKGEPQDKDERNKAALREYRAKHGLPSETES